MIQETDIKIRPMHLNDIEGAMQLKYQEGWNQLKTDWELLIKFSPDSCLVAEYKKKIIGTVTAVNYSNQVAWIGMMLVDRNFRRKGIGRLLMRSVLDKLQKCRSIKLDATPAGYPLYRELGFIDEYNIHRMINPCLAKSAAEDTDSLPSHIINQDIPKISEFDKEIFGVNRTALLSSFIEIYPNRAWILQKQNQISGYMIGRAGSKFNQIGPVLAKSTKNARTLINQALRHLVTQPIAIDILQDKTDLLAWLISLGFEKQRPFTRMFYKSNDFPGIFGEQFAILGPEFG